MKIKAGLVIAFEDELDVDEFFGRYESIFNHHMGKPTYVREKDALDVEDGRMFIVDSKVEVVNND